MDESKNLTKINDNNTKMIKTERIGLEAEDIVADAIKLNVDDDLNEQRDDHMSDNLNKKASNEKNGLPNALDNAVIEDEPNYEIDEIEDEKQSDNKEVLNKKNEDSRKKSEKSSSNKLNADSKGNSSLSSTSNKNSKEKIGEDLNLDKNEKKSDKCKGDEKPNENKSISSNKDESTKECKKDGISSEPESKSSKNKSSTKTKDANKPSDGKGTSPNDKIVWVSGLSSNTRASDLQSLFKKYGKVIGAKIITNTRIPGSRCFGFITMETTEQAEKCIQSLNKTELDGRTITVEKNRLVEDKKKQREKSVEKSDKEGKDSDAKKESKDNDRSRDKKERSRSPRRKSHSPIKRFSHKQNFNNRRPIGSFGLRRGGGLGPRPPFNSGPNPMMVRKFEAERLMRRREIRAKERRRVEDYRKQRDLERKQQEERDKLEREKMRLKIERDRLEREKAEFLRAEREKARIERERIEREREELRIKQVQLPHGRLDDSRMRSSLITSKRPYDDLYWDDRKRFPSSSINAGRSAYEDQEPGYNNYHYDIQSSEYNRRKLETMTSSSISRDYDSKRAIQDSSRSGGHDRDDRRTSANGSSSQIGYYRDSRPSLSSRDRDSRRSNNGGREDNNDWKSNVDRRSDSRYLDKSSLSQVQGNSQSYLSNSRSYGGERESDSWSTNDRITAASNLNKLSYPPAMTDNRARTQSSIPQQIIGPASTIGMYNPSANVPMNNLMSNPSYGNGNLNSSYRRY